MNRILLSEKLKKKIYIFIISNKFLIKIEIYKKLQLKIL